MTLKMACVSGLIIIIFLCGQFCSGLGNDFINRKVLCRGYIFDYKTVQCANSTDDLIAIHSIMYGYQNNSQNCSEVEDFLGCEEPMSDTQMGIFLDKGSATHLINALQFPQTTPPVHCVNENHNTTYMAFSYECLQKSSVLTMCDTSEYSGKRVSVYNPSYNILGSPNDTHHCFCHISSQASKIGITLYDYRLNCTVNSQNLTIEDSDGVVLESQCNKILRGYRNSSGENLTMTWKGESKSSGLFWIGFHAMNYDKNVTVNCHYIPDPTTTTTTTTTTTRSPPVSSSQNYMTNASASPNNAVVSSTQNSTIKAAAENQRSVPLSKTAIYALIGGGALLLIILVVVICVVVRRRSALGDDRLDLRQIQDFQTEMKRRESQNITSSSADDRRESKANVSNYRKQSNVYSNVTEPVERENVRSSKEIRSEKIDNSSRRPRTTNQESNSANQQRKQSDVGRQADAHPSSKRKESNTKRPSSQHKHTQ